MDRLNICFGAFGLHSHEYSHTHSPDELILHAHSQIPNLDFGTPEEQHNVDKIIGQVEQIFRALNEQTDLTPDNPQIHPHLARLVDIAKEDISLSAIFKVLGDKRIENILPELWNKLALIEGEIEIAFTNQQCLNSTVDLNDLLKYNYTGEYEQLVNMELDALFDNCPWLDRSNASSIRFIMIGAGSFPMSAIFFPKITGSKVTCVDVDPRAVELAKTLVSKLGLNEQINVEFSNGDRIDLEGNEIVWIASLVQGKSKVLRTVSKKLKKACSPMVATSNCQLYYCLTVIIIREQLRCALRMDYMA